MTTRLVAENHRRNWQDLVGSVKWYVRRHGRICGTHAYWHRLGETIMTGRVGSGWCTALALVLAGETQGLAQQNVAVQLPTFEQFSISTTVVVPDRGSLYLGGVNRGGVNGGGVTGAGRGNAQFGRGVSGWGPRGLGRSAVGGGLSIQATILDHQELDRAVLAEAARRRGATHDVLGRPVADAPRVRRSVMASATMSSGRMSSGRMSSGRMPSDRMPATTMARTRDGRNTLAPVRRRSTSAAGSARGGSAAEASRAATYLDRAQRAEAKGQAEQAKIFYRRVVKHGDPTLKRQAEARLARLESHSTR